MGAVYVLLSAARTDQLAAGSHTLWLSLFPQMSPRPLYGDPTEREEAYWVGAGMTGAEQAGGRVLLVLWGPQGPLALESCGLTSCACGW